MHPEKSKNRILISHESKRKRGKWRVFVSQFDTRAPTHFHVDIWPRPGESGTSPRCKCVHCTCRGEMI